MKILFIGGTGTISTAISQKILETPEHELFLLNRGSRNSVLHGNFTEIKVDINEEEAVAAKLEGMKFDCVCDFICFHTEQIKRDYRLFRSNTRQFMFISTASAYAKPARDYIISEGTSLVNPHWEYSREKIECENFLMEKYRFEGFPMTIIRPTYTYDERKVPLGVHGANGSFQVIKRMLEGKPVIIHGDGSSLWTMTHNSDFAKAFVGLIGNAHAIGEAFQITSDETLTWDQIYQCIADTLGVKLNAYHVASEFLASVGKQYDFEGGLLGDKSVSVVFDNSKLKRAVPQYLPSVSFREGVQRTINYILTHPDCQQLDPEFDAWCDKVIESLEEAKKKLGF